MWSIDVACSDPHCGEEFEVWVEELDEVDLVVCGCEAGVVVLAISRHEAPVAVG